MKQCCLPRSQKGIVLLEALIAILIFSMGILALVGMQANAIGHVQDAKYRADAGFLANQVIGEIWAKQANLAANPAAYNYPSGGTPPAGLTEWVNTVGATLPGAASNPPQVVINGNQVSVTVRWQPPQSGALHSHVAVAAIACC